MRFPSPTRCPLLPAVPAIALIAVACAPPLIWILIALIAHPSLWADALPNAFRAGLLFRTILYNGLAAILATALALPAALVLGRGRGWIARTLWILLPATLLMPSLAYAYGWSQFIRLNRDHFSAVGLDFIPAGPADIARCVWTLAAWLWPIPAMLIGLSLRRLDPSIQLQAHLDGVLWRITLRRLAGPLVASTALVFLLAGQEFSVYEPTGISVVATEVRMVFETGAFSSLANPITGAVTGTAAAGPDQAARAAAALAIALPLLIITILLSLGAFWLLSPSTGADFDELHAGDWPRALDAPRWTTAWTVLLWLVIVGVPVASLIVAMRSRFDPLDWYDQFGDALDGTFLVAALAVAAAAIIALSASARRTPGLLAAAAICFLVGGQLLAIAVIRTFNRPGLFAVYDSAAITVLVYIGCFAWLPLVAARLTWAGPWRRLRDMAALDGAGPLAAARHVIWPLAWPTLLAGALLVGALSLTEVPATVLLSPQNPQVLTPMLMSWVHMARYDPMIQAVLLMMAMVLLPALLAMILLSRRRRFPPHDRH